MILLVWSSDRAEDCALSIEHSLQESVQLASTLHEGIERLRTQDYSAVVVDQWLTDSEPETTGTLFHHLGPAIPVLVNFGISGAERISRELRAALVRRTRETILARNAARRGLRDELKDDVTALLLSCGVALGEQELGEAAQARLRQIESIAEQIKNKLAILEPEFGPAAGNRARPQES